ncbi:MBL fold metallo-hydrolase [uncultured Thiodictyon sp.]|uniref:MBL fold metallo-hydrolase n=1 Tax=uncultured Thiodictyon sp. TaxID=1846217 RepID=UPI0025CD15C2|nr:MBL fold metallo-hydrolase [uncultured Thiodictyon sp.]
MEILTLIENTTETDSLRSEHGLSLLLKTGKNSQLLFDTGASGAFLDNAIQLGVDLSSISCVVISHGHYDHGGGLFDFFEINKTAKVYISKYAFKKYYSSNNADHCAPIGVAGKPLRYIGLDTERLERYAQRFQSIDDVTNLFDGVYLVPNIVGEYPRPNGNKALFSGAGGDAVHDDFRHEMILVVKEDDGIIIFTGCGHSGILNMIETVRRSHFEGPIKAIVGGLHLQLESGTNSFADESDQITAIGKKLTDLGVTDIHTGHCTSLAASERLSVGFGKKISRIHTGSRFTL